MPNASNNTPGDSLHRLDPLDEAFAFGPRLTPPSSATVVTRTPAFGFLRSLSGRGSRSRGFLPVPPGVPEAGNNELPDIEISATRRPGFFQRLSAWLNRPIPKDPLKRTNQDMLNYLMEYYIKSYSGGVRPFRGSSGGPPRPSRMRGFLAPGAVPSGPVVNPVYPIIRTAPAVPVPEPSPLRLPRLPVIQPYIPPGYEPDPDFHPDLVAEPMPAAPAPRVQPVAPPRTRPAPSVVPAPSTTPMPIPTPRTTPTPAPRPQVTPAPIPQPLPTPFAVPRPLPAPRVSPTPAPLRLPFTSPVPAPGRAQPSRGAPRVGHIPRVAPTPRPVPAPSPSPFADPLRNPPRSRADECNCQEEKKERKSKQPRKKCYKGSYREKSMSLSKSPKEEIPCL